MVFVLFEEIKDWGDQVGEMGFEEDGYGFDQCAFGQEKGAELFGYCLGF